MTATQAAMIMMSGSADLEDITITENGEYESVDHDGFGVVTVDLALDDKSVSLTTSQITGSQTAVFEYDPHSENPELEGYSLFTIDLSGVKDDIEDLQQSIADAETCRQQVIAALQRYDPDYDPAEGECPSDKVGEVVDEVGELEDELEQCHDCKDATVAAMQAIDPDYVLPASGCPDDIPQKAYDKGKDDAPEKYTFPEDDPNNPDPDRYNKIAELVGGDPLTDNDLHIIVKPMDDRYPIVPQGRHNVYYGFYDSITGAFLDRTQAFQGGLDLEHTDYVTDFRITDPSTGAYTFDWVTWSYLYNPPKWGWEHHTYTGTNQNLIGYGDPTHSYTVTNKKNS